MAFNPSILTREFQDFIRSDRASELLSGGVFASPFNGISPQELATQIKGYRKALEKLPRLAARQGIVYPPGLSMEQCSSEATARYKASLLPEGRRCADLTGGFGIDTLALSERFAQVDYYETQTELARIAAHNFSVLEADNISVHSEDGLAALEAAQEEYDLIYADPARRDTHAHRVFSVTDCTPDIASAKELLLSRSRRLLVKLSPMLDIAATLRIFPQTSQVHVVAVRNEVKELLLVIERGFCGQAVCYAADLYPGREDRIFSGKLSAASPAPPVSAPEAYLYDPSAALRKAGLADAYGLSAGLSKLHPSTGLYTSPQHIEGFQGRVFRTLGTVNRKNIEEYFPQRRASVVTRNYPAAAASLAKDFRLKDSERMFLIAFRDDRNRPHLVAAERVDLPSGE